LLKFGNVAEILMVSMSFFPPGGACWDDADEESNETVVPGSEGSPVWVRWWRCRVWTL